MTHGASAYSNLGCRCAECRAGNTARVREYRNRRTNTVPTDPHVTNPGTTKERPRVAPTTGGMAPEEKSL